MCAHFKGDKNVFKVKYTTIINRQRDKVDFKKDLAFENVVASIQEHFPPYKGMVRDDNRLIIAILPWAKVLVFFKHHH